MSSQLRISVTSSGLKFDGQTPVVADQTEDQPISERPINYNIKINIDPKGSGRTVDEIFADYQKPKEISPTAKEKLMKKQMTEENRLMVSERIQEKLDFVHESIRLSRDLEKSGSKQKSAAWEGLEQVKQLGSALTQQQTSPLNHITSRVHSRDDQQVLNTQYIKPTLNEISSSALRQPAHQQHAAARGEGQRSPPAIQTGPAFNEEVGKKLASVQSVKVQHNRRQDGSDERSISRSPSPYNQSNQNSVIIAATKTPPPPKQSRQNKKLNNQQRYNTLADGRYQLSHQSQKPDSTTVIDPAGNVGSINEYTASQKGQLVSKNVQAKHKMLYDGKDVSERAIMNAKLNTQYPNMSQASGSKANAMYNSLDTSNQPDYRMPAGKQRLRAPGLTSIHNFAQNILSQNQSDDSIISTGKYETITPLDRQSAAPIQSHLLNSSQDQDHIRNHKESKISVELKQFSMFSANNNHFSGQSRMLHADSSIHPLEQNQKYSFESSQSLHQQSNQLQSFHQQRMPSNPQVMQKFINYENKFNQSFSKHEAITASNFHSGGSMKMRNTRIGQMMSRKQIQDSLEFVKVENKANQSLVAAPRGGQALTTQHSSAKFKASMQRSIVNSQSIGSSSIQVQNLASHIHTTSSLQEVGFTDAMPNVLGSKAKHLDLLEDQRNEIERIVKKKKKQLRNLEHPSEKSAVQVSGFHTMQQNSEKGRMIKQKAVLSQHQPSQSLAMKEIKQMISINDELTKSATRKKGGGFFSPTATARGDGSVDDGQQFPNNHAYADQAPNATSKYAGTGQGSAVALPKISGRNQAAFEHSTIGGQKTTNAMTSLKLNTAQKVQGLKSRIANQKSTKLHGAQNPHEAELQHINPKHSVHKGGQPNSLKLAKLNTQQRPVRQPDDSKTPDLIKNNMNKIINNNSYMDSKLKNDPTFKKERLQEFQNDFENKMQKMNIELQREVEADAGGLEKVSPDKAKQEAAKKKQKMQLVASLAHSSKKPESSVEALKPQGTIASRKSRIAENTEHLPGIQAPVKPQVSKYNRTTMRREKMRPEVQLVGRQKTLRDNNQQQFNQSIDSGTIDEVVSEDWLDVEAPKDQQVAQNALDVGQGPQGEAADGDEVIRLYTPPSHHDLEEQNDYEGKLLRMKAKQRNEFNQKDIEAKGEGKDANHLTESEIEKIQARYMPMIDQMRTKLSVLDLQKKPSTSGQVSQISAPNADASQIKDKAIKHFLDGIQTQSEFYGIAKHASSPMINMKQKVDPKASFFSQCEQQGVVALPTLSRIQEKVLNLRGYGMNLGICQALGQAFILYRDILEKLFLESTGTDDKMFAAILEGLVEQTHFKAITYKANALDHLSVTCILKMIERPMPSNLDELRIINCKISPAAIKLLVENITRSNLRKLSLVKAGIAGKPQGEAKAEKAEEETEPGSYLFDKILTLLRKSRSLVELDISWNRLGPDDLLELFKVISNNRQLQQLNVSWNHIQEEQKMDTEAQSERTRQNEALWRAIENTKATIEEIRNRKPEDDEEEMPPAEQQESELDVAVSKLEELHGQVTLLKEQADKLTSEEELIFENIGKFIKHNKNLQQLDLSHTQLKPNLLRELCITLRKAKSLLTLDVSGNLGQEPADTEVREFISQRIRCKPDPYDLERLAYISDFIQDINKNYDSKALKNEKILLSMQMRNIKQITSISNSNKISSVRTYQNNEDLIYQRILGHKVEIPGSAQWIETSTATAPSDNLDDWVTNKCIYTMIFWSKKLARESQKKSPYSQKEIAKLHWLLKAPDVEQMKQNIKNVQNRLEPIPYIVDQQVIHPEDEVEEPPMFAGSLNNWQYAPMYKIEDFLMMLDSGFTDPLQDMLENGLIGTEEVKKLDARELKPYVAHRFRMLKNYKQNWSQILMNKCMKYKNPCFVNLTEFDNYPEQRHLQIYDDAMSQAWTTDPAIGLSASRKNVANINELLSNMKDADDLYVGVTIARPGRHTYIVKYRDDSKEDELHANAIALKKKFTSMDSMGAKLMAAHEEADGEEDQGMFSMHRCLIQAREETVPPFVKAAKSHMQQRVFKKETSVFREWREDTESMFSSCFASDTSHWKVQRLIKNPDDFLAVEALLRKHFARLKKIFIVQASKSGFPTINWINSADFIRDCNVLDGNVIQTTVDRLFIATNQELEKSEENPANALERYEFMEFVTRIAEKKFKEPKICKTYEEAVEKLLEEHIFKLGDKEDWQEFRDEKLWTIDVNDVFEANLADLQRIYAMYFAPRKKYMDMKDALKFLMKDTDLNLIEKDAIFCYGMCKMTVDKEHEKNAEYFRLQFVEFLEMIGRVAHQKFRSTTMSEEPLAKQIEFVLDEIIPVMLESERKPVDVHVEEVSESDDDY